MLGLNANSMDLLKNTQFLKLWSNQILLQIAFNLAGFTALLLIDHLTSSRFALAQFYAMITLPAFLVGIYAGSIIDLTNRKKLMLITDLLLTLLFLGYIFAAGHYWTILFVAFLASSVSQFFTPAESATIPMLVSEKQLEHANALFLFTTLGAVMAGYALAGPIIQLFGGIEKGGAEAAFSIASASAAIGSILLFSLKTIETEKPQLKAKNVLNTTWKLTKEIFWEVKNNIKISLSIGLLALIEFSIGMLAIIFIDYVKIYLKFPSTSISYFLIIPLIIGLIIGISIMETVQKWLGRGSSMFIGILTFGLIILSLGFASKSLSLQLLRILTMASAVAVGITAVFETVHPRTILQENTPPEMLGRVFAFVTVTISAVVPVPILLLTLIGEKVDAATIFMVFGAGLILIALGLKRILEVRFN